MGISTFTGLQTALRGLPAQQRALDVTSHNVANVDTAGYTRQEAVLRRRTGAERRPPAPCSRGAGAPNSGPASTSCLPPHRATSSSTSSAARRTCTGWPGGAGPRAGTRSKRRCAEPGENGIADQLQQFWSVLERLANSPRTRRSRRRRAKRRAASPPASPTPRPAAGDRRRRGRRRSTPRSPGPPAKSARSPAKSGQAQRRDPRHAQRRRRAQRPARPPRPADRPPLGAMAQVRSPLLPTARSRSPSAAPPRRRSQRHDRDLAADAERILPRSPAAQFDGLQDAPPDRRRLPRSRWTGFARNSPTRHRDQRQRGEHRRLHLRRRLQRAIDPSVAVSCPEAQTSPPAPVGDNSVALAIAALRGGAVEPESTPASSTASAPTPAKPIDGRGKPAVAGLAVHRTARIDLRRLDRRRNDQHGPLPARLPASARAR